MSVGAADAAMGTAGVTEELVDVASPVAVSSVAEGAEDLEASLRGAISFDLSAARSRIQDADFAAESAELARTQVLQQAGLSVLAQANARPQQVLQLLQG